MVRTVNSKDHPYLKNMDDVSERKLQDLMTNLSKSCPDLNLTCAALLSMMNKSWLTVVQSDTETKVLTKELTRILEGPETDVSRFLNMDKSPKEEEMEEELSPFPSPISSPLRIESPPPLNFTPPPLSPCYPIDMDKLSSDFDVFDELFE